MSSGSELLFRASAVFTILGALAAIAVVPEINIGVRKMFNLEKTESSVPSPIIETKQGAETINVPTLTPKSSTPKLSPDIVPSPDINHDKSKLYYSEIERKNIMCIFISIEALRVISQMKDDIGLGTNMKINSKSIADSFKFSGRMAEKVNINHV